MSKPHDPTTSPPLRDYASILDASARINWQLDEVLPPGVCLDFSKRMLPESMAATKHLDGLARDERLLLNQIRAFGYLEMFRAVESAILPMMLEHLGRRASAELDELRALLGFAQEEAKHIQLFERFEVRFVRGFGQPCLTIAPEHSIAQHVLKADPLGMALFVLHVEWMTQRHYVGAMHDDTGLEPSFRRMLHMHFLEECQHGRIDEWIVQDAILRRDESQHGAAFREYVRLLSFFDEGLREQADADLATLQRVAGRTLPGTVRDEIRTAQHAALRRTFIGSGLTHPRVHTILRTLHPEAEAHLGALRSRYTGTSAA